MDRLPRKSIVKSVETAGAGIVKKVKNIYKRDKSLAIGVKFQPMNDNAITK